MFLHRDVTPLNTGQKLNRRETVNNKIKGPKHWNKPNLEC